jgi:hypothetical protein
MYEEQACLGLKGNIPNRAKQKGCVSRDGRAKEEGKGGMGEDTGYNLPIVLRPYNGRPQCQHLYVPSNSPPSPPFPLRSSLPPSSPRPPPSPPRLRLYHPPYRLEFLTFGSVESLRTCTQIACLEFP